MGGRRPRRPDVPVAPGGEIVDEIKLPEGLRRLPARSAGRMAASCCCAPRPDFIEANRKDVREAVLFTTTVDVPHRGLP